VDDVKSTLMHQTPATGLSAYVAAAQSCTAPMTSAHGTRVSFAGTSAAQAAAVLTAGVRNIDLPGSPPRGAPV
jgi:hypothetical protein